MFFIPSGRLDNQSLNSLTGSPFPPSVLNIACGVVLRLMVRPPLCVLVRPSRNSTTSVPSSRCLMITSSTYVSLCSWRPRNPRCSVKFLKLTLVKTFPLKSPNWPFSHKTDSSFWTQDKIKKLRVETIFEQILYLFSSFRWKPFSYCPGKIVNQS